MARSRKPCAAGSLRLAEWRRDVDCSFGREATWKRRPGCRCVGCGVDEFLEWVEAKNAARRH